MIRELFNKVREAVKGGSLSGNEEMQKEFQNIVKAVKGLQFEPVVSYNHDEDFAACMELCNVITPGHDYAFSYQLIQCAYILAFRTLQYASKNGLYPFKDKAHEQYEVILEKFKMAFIKSKPDDFERKLFQQQIKYTQNCLHAINFMTYYGKNTITNFFSQCEEQLSQSFALSIASLNPLAFLSPLFATLKLAYQEHKKEISKYYYDAYVMMGLLSFVMEGKKHSNFYALQELIAYKNEESDVFRFQLYALSELFQQLNEREDFAFLDNIGNAFSRYAQYFNSVNDNNTRLQLTVRKKETTAYRRQMLIAMLKKLHKSSGEVKKNMIEGALSGLNVSFKQTDFLAKLHYLDHFIQHGLSKRESARGQNVIAVLGNTGAGKSTTIASLIGAEVAEDESEDVDPGNNLYPLKIQPGADKQYPIVGQQSSQSQTTYPESWIDQELSLAYIDCPGFLHTRPDQDFGISLLMQSTLEAENFCRVKGCLILVNVHDFTSTKAENFLNLMSIINSFFRKESIVDVEQHCIFGFTHLPERNISEAGYKKKLELYKKLIEKIRNELKAQFKETKEYAESSQQNSSFSNTLYNMMTGVFRDKLESWDKNRARYDMAEMLLKAFERQHVVLLYPCDNKINRNRLREKLTTIVVTDTNLNSAFNFRSFDKEKRHDFFNLLAKESSKVNTLLRNEKQCREDILRILGKNDISKKQKSTARFSDNILKNSFETAQEIEFTIQEIIKREAAEREEIEQCKIRVDRKKKAINNEVIETKLKAEEITKIIEKICNEISVMETKKNSLDVTLIFQDRQVIQEKEKQLHQKSEEIYDLRKRKAALEELIVKSNIKLRAIHNWKENYQTEHDKIELSYDSLCQEKIELDNKRVRSEQLAQLTEENIAELTKINSREVSHAPYWSVERRSGWGRQYIRFTYMHQSVEVIEYSGEWMAEKATPFIPSGVTIFPPPISKIHIESVAYYSPIVRVSTQVLAGGVAGGMIGAGFAAGGGVGLAVGLVLFGLCGASKKFEKANEHIKGIVCEETVLPGTTPQSDLVLNQPILFDLPHSEFITPELGFSTEERVAENAQFLCVYGAPFWPWKEKKISLNIYIPICYSPGNPNKILSIKKNLREYQREIDGLLPEISVENKHKINEKIKLCQERIKRYEESLHKKDENSLIIVEKISRIHEELSHLEVILETKEKEKERLEEELLKINLSLNAESRRIQEEKSSIISRMREKREIQEKFKADKIRLENNITTQLELLNNFDNDTKNNNFLSLMVTLNTTKCNLREQLLKLQELEENKISFEHDIEQHIDFIQSVVHIFESLAIPLEDERHIQELLKLWKDKERWTEKELSSELEFDEDLSQDNISAEEIIRSSPPLIQSGHGFQSKKDSSIDLFETQLSSVLNSSFKNNIHTLFQQGYRFSAKLCGDDHEQLEICILSRPKSTDGHPELESLQVQFDRFITNSSEHLSREYNKEERRYVIGGNLFFIEQMSKRFELIAKKYTNETGKVGCQVS